MSLTTATISGATLSLTVSPQVLSPLTSAVKISLPFTFASLSYLKTFAGSFTPANNQLTIVNSGIPSNADDYFVLLIVDGQANLSITAVLETPYIPVTKAFMMTLKGDSSNQISTIAIDGRTSVPDPMTQGVAVNYTMVLARGVIT